MELLDFERLVTCLEYKDPKQTITVVLYSKEGSGYVLHSKEEHPNLVTHLERNRASGKVGEVFYADSCVLVGIEAGEKDPIVLRSKVRKAAAGIHGIIFDESEVVFADSPYTEDAVYGFVISSYSYNFLKKSRTTKNIFLNAPKHTKTVQVAHAQNFARFLGDSPANLMTPTLFSLYAKRFLGEEKIETNVYDKEFMKSRKMNLILSVSQGSAEEPKLLHLKYFGKEDRKVDIALVGKGVTFDSGGISIKPSANMADMKNDMMGAATLLATFKLVVTLGLKVNVTATFPLVENMPGSRATKPGDVFHSMSGLSVVVDNTDAEGRLILADAITFAQQDKPEYLLDAATLTGAMNVALGNVYGGFFTNDDELGSLIYKAGIKTCDMLWRMPLSPYYRESLSSHVADINNMASSPGGGSAKAAEFLHEFIEEGTKWAHFDIAGLMNKSFNSGLYGENATGRPVPAFLEIIEGLMK